MLRIKDCVKNEFLVKEYGFTKTVISNSPEVCEFVLKEEGSYTLIQRCGREIYCVIPGDWDTDCVPISDVIYRLIVDGLVERI